MKVYIVTDKDIKSLHDKLKMEKFTRKDDGDDKFLVDKLYRFFNYHIHDWVNEISKEA